MKKIIILLVMLTFLGCNKDEPKECINNEVLITMDAMDVYYQFDVAYRHCSLVLYLTVNDKIEIVYYVFDANTLTTLNPNNPHHFDLQLVGNSFVVTKTKGSILAIQIKPF